MPAIRYIRVIALIIPLFVVSLTWAQSGNLPMSNELHDRLAPSLHALGSSAHTSIKPYRYRDVKGLDSLGSVLPILDRWAHRSDTVIRGFTESRGEPLLDAQFGMDLGEDDPITYHAGAGFWAELDAGPKWSFHVDGQAWITELPTFLDSFTVATQNIPGQGYANKSGTGYQHYDVNAYVNFSPSKFFDLSLGRGKNFFGEGRRSLFLSDHAYSYPYLRISTNVWKVRYVNLFTMMSDIRGADGSVTDFTKKYASMHYLSWNATDRVNFSIFEAIIWQSNDNEYERGFDVNYLNPVIFYRPVEFGLGSPDNALLGFAFNVKIGKKGLAYSQLMFDEFLLSEIRKGEGWFANKQALQLGLLFHDAVGVGGFDVRTELNYVRPFMYTHSDTRQNYAHHGLALAHPYGSNFWEWTNEFTYRSKRLTIKNTFSISEMGQDTGIYSWGNNIFREENDRVREEANGPYINRGFYLLDPVKNTLIQNEIKGSWALAPASGIRLEASYMLRSITREVGEDSFSNWFRIGLVSYFRQSDPFSIERYRLD